MQAAVLKCRHDRMHGIETILRKYESEQVNEWMTAHHERKKGEIKEKNEVMHEPLGSVDIDVDTAIDGS